MQRVTCAPGGSDPDVTLTADGREIGTKSEAVSGSVAEYTVLRSKRGDYSDVLLPQRGVRQVAGASSLSPAAPKRLSLPVLQHDDGEFMRCVSPADPNATPRATAVAPPSRAQRRATAGRDTA